MRVFVLDVIHTIHKASFAGITQTGTTSQTCGLARCRYRLVVISLALSTKHVDTKIVIVYDTLTTTHLQPCQS